MRNKNLFRLVVNLNLYLFPFLSVLSVFLFFLESVTYSGFVSRFFLFGPRFFGSLSIFSLFLVVILFCANKSINNDFYWGLFVVYFIRACALMFFPCLFFYFIMVVLNTANYPNYVFSRFHINPAVFFDLVVFLMFVFVFFLVLEFILPRKTGLLSMVSGAGKSINFVSERAIKELALPFENFDVKNIIFVIFSLFILGHIFLITFSETFYLATSNFISDLKISNSSYEEKMSNQWGVLFDYLKFVRELTPKDSIIVIPPAVLHWQDLGNGAISNYFLFPRKLISGSLDYVPTDGVDYIMIARGSWLVEGVENYGWPKCSVEAEKVIYFDPLEKEIWEREGDFDVNYPLNKYAWGLIKLKEGESK